MKKRMEDSAKDKTVKKIRTIDTIDDNNTYQYSLNLPRKLYCLVREKNKNIIIHNIHDTEETLLDKARSLILENNDELQKLFTKAKKRSHCYDGKVPPGSSTVRRSLHDPRYLLSLIAIQQSQNEHCSIEACKEHLLESLIWFPRNIISNYQFAELLRINMKEGDKSEEYFSRIINYYEKAIETGYHLSALQRSEKESNYSAFQSHNLSVVPAPSGLDLRVAIDDESFTVMDEEAIEITDHDLVSLELEAFESARSSYAFFLCQIGRGEVANRLLSSMGYGWKLSSNVLNYPSGDVTSNPLSKDSCNYLSVLDDVLTETVLDHLSNVFRFSSPFWKEHKYDLKVKNCSESVGYFSYLYPMKERSPCCSIEQIIDCLFDVACERFPSCCKANYAEWWVHSRPHYNGHQLHFDSDETRILKGNKPAHPIVSLAVYISDGIGGPVLVTNQSLASTELAICGWMTHPKRNRMVVFDASYLHGVVPGKGSIPILEHHEKGGPRRLSFMVGFWESICAKDRGVDSPGPGQPFPDERTSKYTWPKEMGMIEELQVRNKVLKDNVHLHSPIYVEKIWERVEGQGGGAREDAQPDYNICFQGF
eukprot:gene10057-13517_t